MKRFESIAQIEEYDDVLKEFVTNDENDFFFVIELYANFVEDNDNVELAVNLNLIKSNKNVF